MTDDLIERMARAHQDILARKFLGQPTWGDLEAQHKATRIEAMRAAWAEAAEPSEAMYADAEFACSGMTNPPDRTTMLWVWQAMHGAAVVDEKN